MHQISRKDIRKFGITLGVIFAIIGTIHLLKGNINFYPWFYAVGALGFILGFFIPVALRPVYFVFTKIAHVIGVIITGLVLIIVFYIILTPIGLIAKLSGKNFLDIDWKKKSNTYWLPKQAPGEDTERYERQF